MPIGPLHTVSEAVEQAQIQHRKMIATVEHPLAGPIKLSNSPLHLSRTPGRVRGAAPLFGQDTEAVLSELLGLNVEQVQHLVDQGVVLTEGGPDIERYLEA